ncbi:MAG TPA: hypothetical protein VKX25_04090 [Bryobacteraceae bacterium]|jgi:hypothetical protein|nr:hypothetical protein [Bryobacteraceae bacterium]
MSVFDAANKTATVVKDPVTDRNLAPPASLSYGAIASVGALAGTNGVDTNLVFGNRDRQLNGNESTRITQNRSHQIGQNQIEKVGVNKTETTGGNYSETTYGATHTMNVGPTDETFVGTHTVQHKDNQVVEEPVTYLHSIQNFIEQHGFHADFHHITVFYSELFSSFVGVYTDVRPVYVMTTGISGSWTYWDNQAKALDNKLSAINAKIEAIQPEVSITMVHEVAVTQKILVIGVNQFM